MNEQMKTDEKVKEQPKQDGKKNFKPRPPRKQHQDKKNWVSMGWLLKDKLNNIKVKQVGEVKNG